MAMGRPRLWPAVCAGAMFLCGGAWGASLPAELAGLAPGCRADVIVRFRGAAVASVLRAVEERGAAIGGAFPLLGAAALSLDAADLPRLAAVPELLYIAPDRPIRAVKAFRPAEREWAALLAVASSHPLSSEPAGVALIGPVSERAGDRPGSPIRLIPLPVLDAAGAGRESAALAAMETTLRTREARRIRILALAFAPAAAASGGDPLADAVRHAFSAGILVVEAGRPETDSRRSFAPRPLYRVVRY